MIGTSQEAISEPFPEDDERVVNCQLAGIVPFEPRIDKEAAHGGAIGISPLRQVGLDDRETSRLEQLEVIPVP